MVLIVGIGRHSRLPDRLSPRLWATSVAVLAGVLAPSGAHAESPFVNDGVLGGLVEQALRSRPELAQARAQIRAGRERVPQSRALPDPSLTLGIQNDGFQRIQIGRMETSYLAVSAAQTFPWLGKRSLRADIAGLGVRESEADLERARLSTVAEVERAYLDVLLVRDRLALLARLESLWAQSEGLVRIRYETGEAAQSDLLRVQLERDRLRQRGLSLRADEGRRLAALNRVVGRPIAEPLATETSLATLPDPAVADWQQAASRAETDSPELRKALLAGTQMGKRVELAQKERWPDLTVMAGLMPRWGHFETMWQAGLTVSVPVWSASKQTRAIAENRARGEAAASGADVIRLTLHQRARERQTLLSGLVESHRIYRSALLPQSEATVSSTLAQYQVGRVTFVSVLEALAGYLSDQNAFLDSVAAAQRIAIAQREISLDAPEGGGGMSFGASIGAGASAGAASAPTGSAPAASEAAAGAEGMGRM